MVKRQRRAQKGAETEAGREREYRQRGEGEMEERVTNPKEGAR